MPPNDYNMTMTDTMGQQDSNKMNHIHQQNGYSLSQPGYNMANGHSEHA